MSRLALAQGHAREYETVYILRPNIDREDADGVAGRVVDAIRDHDGVLSQAELWGRRRLAYPIKKHHRGVYVYVKYLSTGDAVSEIERQLRLADGVIRYQTVLVRSNVPVASVEAQGELDLDFDLPEEPDEPELTRERELGLDQTFSDRRGRPRDDDEPADDDMDAESEGDLDEQDEQLTARPRKSGDDEEES
jgi:small subunit ribosomal protein S6